MKRIAFCIAEEQRPAPLDSRFGRAAMFYLLSGKSGEILEKFHNPHAADTQGAGLAAVQMLSGKNVDCIVAPKLGVKVADLCDKLGIPVYDQGNNATLEEAWGLWMQGSIPLALKPASGGLYRG